jgi:hypothetical protein
MQRLCSTAVLPAISSDLPADEIVREALPRILVGGTVSPDNAYPWFDRTAGRTLPSLKLGEWRLSSNNSNNKSNNNNKSKRFFLTTRAYGTAVSPFPLVRAVLH